MLPAFLAALNRGFNKNCKIPWPSPPLDSVHNVKAYVRYKPNVTTAEYWSCVCRHTVADVNSSFIVFHSFILSDPLCQGIWWVRSGRTVFDTVHTCKWIILISTTSSLLAIYQYTSRPKKVEQLQSNGIFGYRNDSKLMAFIRAIEFDCRERSNKL